MEHPSSAATLLVRGMIIGFSVAAPVGAIGLLCIRRSLTHGFATGFCTGLGAATADALYGAIAAFGLTAIANVFLEFRTAFAVGGGALLCWIGIQSLLKTSHAVDGSAETPLRLVTAYATTIALTLANPTTILWFIGIFAGAGLAQNATFLSAMLMTAGVFLGSAIWWLILAATVNRARHGLNARWLRVGNIISGALMLAFGLSTLWRGLAQ